MRCGILVIDKDCNPVKDVEIMGNIIPPLIKTDEKGEAFFIAPFFLSPALYLLDITISNTIRIVDIAFEIENYYIVNIDAKTWCRKEFDDKEQLHKRIPGDSFFNPTQKLLDEKEILYLDKDPVLSISNCRLCLYLFPLLFPSGYCTVNKLKSKWFFIKNTSNTTCPQYYPFFLLPSLQRLKRDIERILSF